LTTTKSEHPIEAAEFTPNSEKIIIEHQVDRERREISFTVWDIRGEKKISEFVPPVKRMYMETADFIERRISDQFLNERISIRISEDSQYMYVFKDPQTFQFISLHDGKVKKSIKVPFEEYFPKLRFGEKEKFFVATVVFSGKIHKIDRD
jgi:hypothetical protein